MTMNIHRTWCDPAALGAGLIILSAGIILLLAPGLQGARSASAPYVLIGVGCGLGGYGGGNLIARRLIRKNPELARKIRIEEEDERNRLISLESRARAFNLMTIVQAGVILFLTLTGTPLPLILLLTGSYLLAQVYSLVLQIQRNSRL